LLSSASGTSGGVILWFSTNFGLNCTGIQLGANGMPAVAMVAGMVATLGTDDEVEAGVLALLHPEITSALVITGQSLCISFLSCKNGFHL
jgi:hypothetical protein